MDKYLVICPEKRDVETKQIILPRIEGCVEANSMCEAFSIAASRYSEYKDIKIYPWKYPT